jgi:phosphomannomutase
MNTPPYTHLFFDLDGTVTEKRSIIADEMRFRLSTLTQDVIIVSSVEYSQMKYQLNGLPCLILAQHGRYAYDAKTNEVIWNDTLSSMEIAEIEAHIRSLPRTWAVPNENDLVQNRGCEISYSLYGHNASPAEKNAFDPDGAKRRALLHAHPFRSMHVDVTIVGDTCLEYFQKGSNKGRNVLRFIAHKGWREDECIYFGDEIFPGGDDETMYGMLETQGVQNANDLFDRLTAYVK